jgi:hypothetical protein
MLVEIMTGTSLKDKQIVDHRLTGNVRRCPVLW